MGWKNLSVHHGVDKLVGLLPWPWYFRHRTNESFQPLQWCNPQVWVPSRTKILTTNGGWNYREGFCTFNNCEMRSLHIKTDGVRCEVHLIPRFTFGYVTKTILDIWVVFFPDGVWSIVLAWPWCINSGDSDRNLEVDRLLSASLLPERNVSALQRISKHAYIPGRREYRMRI